MFMRNNLEYEIGGFQPTPRNKRGQQFFDSDEDNRKERRDKKGKSTKRASKDGVSYENSKSVSDQPIPSTSVHNRGGDSSLIHLSDMPQSNMGNKRNNQYMKDTPTNMPEGITPPSDSAVLGTIIRQRRRGNRKVQTEEQSSQQSVSDTVLKSSLLKDEINTLELKAKQGEKVEDAEVVSEEMVRTLEKKRDFVFSKEKKNIPNQEPSRKEEPEREKIEPEIPQEQSEERTDMVFGEGKEQSLEQSPQEPTEEKSPSNIDLLRNEVELARTQWVETDVKNTTAWKKFKSLFGIEKDTKKDDTQIAYERALDNLRDAEIHALQARGNEERQIVSEEKMQEEITRMLRYYKLDEAINLINTRTQYKAEHQTFSEKMMDSLGALGRAYNRIPLKHKLLLTGALAGITIGTALSGGTAIGAMASVMLLRKVASGAGTAVGVEALLESFGTRGQKKQAEKEIQEQLGILSDTKPEATFSRLNFLIEKDIQSLGGKLEKEKRVKTWRKMGALGIGGLGGSGWLAQTVMEETGAGEWIKDKTDALFISHDTVPGVAKEVVLPDVHKDVVDLSAGKVSDILDKDYIVQKGDSVWKIAGHVADELHLKGAERTSFIDALKDKYGDVQLKTGETINFSKQGVDSQFVFEKLMDTKALSSEKLASITSNDAKIAEFVRNNPTITLTNESADTLLHGNEGSQSISAPVQGDEIPSSSNTVDFAEDASQITSESVDQSVHSVSAETTFDSILQPRVNDWYMQIFRVENPTLGQDWIVDKTQIGKVEIMDMMKDARLYNQGSLSGYATGLNGEQLKNFADFSQQVDKYAITFDKKAFFYSHPHATVMDYLKEVAPLIPKGQRLGLYTTSN